MNISTYALEFFRDELTRTANWLNALNQSSPFKLSDYIIFKGGPCTIPSTDYLYPADVYAEGNLTIEEELERNRYIFTKAWMPIEYARIVTYNSLDSINEYIYISPYKHGTFSMYLNGDDVGYFPQSRLTESRWVATFPTVPYPEHFMQDTVSQISLDTLETRKRIKSYTYKSKYPGMVEPYYTNRLAIPPEVLSALSYTFVSSIKFYSKANDGLQGANTMIALDVFLEYVNNGIISCNNLIASRIT